MTTRSVPVLMGLGTYQGMTDAEIESIIEYKIGCALRNAGLADAIERSARSLDELGNAAREHIMRSATELQRDVEKVMV